MSRIAAIKSRPSEPESIVMHGIASRRSLRRAEPLREVEESDILDCRAENGVEFAYGLVTNKYSIWSKRGWWCRVGLV